MNLNYGEMDVLWDVVIVKAGEASVEDEPLGTKEKFWVENPEDMMPWLFKYAREIDGRVLGEDWAEWLVHKFGLLLGMPTAEIRPATCEDRRGIVSKTVVPLTGRLVHGNSLLSESSPEYDPERRRENEAYTVAAVFGALDGAKAPPGMSAVPAMTAFEVWAGYLLLDALVAGRDRHHENWGIINDGGNRYIAPSFDHGNALGFQEFDHKRLRCLRSDAQMLSWSKRGRSHHFAGKPTLVALAMEALALCRPEAREYWRIAIQNMSEDTIAKIVAAVPSAVMSEVTRSFVIKLVLVNRKRVFDDYPVD
jgi:hypothetical protein